MSAWSAYLVDQTYHVRDSVPLQWPPRHVLEYLNVSCK